MHFMQCTAIIRVWIWGGTHHKKRRSIVAKIEYRGMIPIAKNIMVVDERGNEYEATYLKRARGLVKNGRARFITENKICLACPPNHKTEDIEMDNNIIIDDMSTEAAIGRAFQEAPQADASKINAEAAIQLGAPELSMAYIMSRIEAIADDSKYFREALNAIKDMPASEVSGGNSYMGDIAGQAKAEAIGQSIQARETTNQQLIHLLEKMYDDLKPKAPSVEVQMFKQLSDALSNFPREYAAEILKNAAQQMFVRAGAAVV